MCTSNLRNWPILSSLKTDIVSQIHMVMIYGELGNEVLFVTKDKMVYALGNNESGCLGTGDNRNGYLYPAKIKALCEKDIKTFACGSGPNVLALTKDGKIYSWGGNEWGELGTGSYDLVDTPTLINMPTLEDDMDTMHVVDIACGSHHSVALTESGKVYTWGITKYKIKKQNRSISNGEDIVSTPMQVKSILSTKKIVHISCGMTFTMAVTDNGEVYSWGNNDVSQLGINNSVDQTTPWQVISLRNVVIAKVACGFEHTLALTDEGDLYAWGGNNYGQLGIGKRTDCKPVKVEHEMGRVSDIAAVYCKDISIAVNQKGCVYVWGNCYGLSVMNPIATLFSDVHDALACYTSPSVMHKPLILDSNEELGILKYLRNAFDDSSTSDFKIQVEDQYIYVHKAVLSIRCSYFRTMFQQEWANKDTIKLDQFSYVVYGAFLKYLYTDMVDLPWEKMLDLLTLANTYCDNNLKMHCIRMIKQKITVLNVVYLYSIAIKDKEEDLEEFCFKFAMNHLTTVVQTEYFDKLDETVLKTFIIKAAIAGGFRT
ncbi:PREDICTED: RCC1 and BTB domain-containing protein 1-like [Cyphomyrmex costatus]|uniref:RCC1 and BTB domain-containing protein 1-like n=1 Tax=Cyphomyrmex costatus TaxID=456900 RepID=UPI00085242B3|nr:PREDICTED: RCC1 and BTB domain-containing protein 1-like [Cyphomyrmex costatus]